MRPLTRKCKQGEAVNAFRELFDETGKLPSANEVLTRVGKNVELPIRDGDDVYLRSTDGFCYGPGCVGVVGRPEKINGKKTGRILNCNAYCGCYKHHHPPDMPLDEPEPIDLPDGV
jgi:hypothetical protein